MIIVIVKGDGYLGAMATGPANEGHGTTWAGEAVLELLWV